MTRRSSSLALAGLVALAVLLPAATATAAPRAALVSPGRDAVVSSPVELRVRVTRDVLDPDARHVQVRLSSDGNSAASGSRAVALTCVSGCGTTDAVWAGAAYDPATASPFGAGPACNGRWYLQVSIDGGAFGSATPVVASAPARPASDVRVAIDGRDAVVTWGASPEPDIAGYRIERRGDDGAWASVGQAAADATRFVDADVEVGGYEWRVVTLRPDGRGAAPCADRDADLATTSASTKGRVTEAPPSPSPTEETPGTGTPTDAATDGGTAGDGPATPGGSEDDSAAPAGTAAPAPSAGAPSEVPASGQTPADAPEDRPSEAEERFYGEDQGVSLLDYGSDATAAAPSGDTAVAGGVSVPFESELDQERLLRPIAGGMVLLTFAFHIRRWQREHDV